MVEIGTHCQLGFECKSTCVSNLWLMHAQTVSKSDHTPPKKTINTPVLRTRGFCSVHTGLTSPSQWSSSLRLGLPGYPSLGPSEPPQRLFLKERLFESYSKYLVVLAPLKAHDWTGQEPLYKALEIVPTLLVVASSLPRTNDDPSVKLSAKVETILPTEKPRHMQQVKLQQLPAP